MAGCLSIAKLWRGARLGSVAEFQLWLAASTNRRPLRDSRYSRNVIWLYLDGCLVDALTSCISDMNGRCNVMRVGFRGATIKLLPRDLAHLYPGEARHYFIWRPGLANNNAECSRWSVFRESLADIDTFTQSNINNTPKVIVPCHVDWGYVLIAQIAMFHKADMLLSTEFLFFYLYQTIVRSV